MKRYLRVHVEQLQSSWVVLEFEADDPRFPESGRRSAMSSEIAAETEDAIRTQIEHEEGDVWEKSEIAVTRLEEIDALTAGGNETWPVAPPPPSSAELRAEREAAGQVALVLEPAP